MVAACNSHCTTDRSSTARPHDRHTTAMPTVKGILRRQCQSDACTTGCVQVVAGCALQTNCWSCPAANTASKLAKSISHQLTAPWTNLWVLYRISRGHATQKQGLCWFQLLDHYCSQPRQQDRNHGMQLSSQSRLAGCQGCCYSLAACCCCYCWVLGGQRGTQRDHHPPARQQRQWKQSAELCWWFAVCREARELSFEQVEVKQCRWQWGAWGRDKKHPAKARRPPHGSCGVHVSAYVL